MKDGGLVSWGRLSRLSVSLRSEFSVTSYRVDQIRKYRLAAYAALKLPLAIDLLVFTVYSDACTFIIINKCIGDDTKAAACQSLNCFKTNQIKYGEKRFSIWRMEFLHPAMWHVALESWQWIHQVAAPCNVIRGYRMTCHWIRPNVRHIGILHLVSISTTSPQSTCHSAPVHQSPKFYPNRTTLGRKNDAMSIFKMADLSHLGL